MNRPNRRLRLVYRLAAYALKYKGKPMSFKGLSEETGFPLERVHKYMRRNRDFCESLGLALRVKHTADDYRTAIETVQKEHGCVRPCLVANELNINLSAAARFLRNHRDIKEQTIA